MENNKDILKEKLNLWLEFIKKEKDILKSLRKFEDLFEGKYRFEAEEDIEQDYYEEYRDNYYLSDDFKVVNRYGPFDKFGSLTSHRGNDLIIYSELILDEDDYREDKYKNEIFIFSEDEYRQRGIDALESLIKKL